VRPRSQSQPGTVACQNSSFALCRLYAQGEARRANGVVPGLHWSNFQVVSLKLAGRLSWSLCLGGPCRIDSQHGFGSGATCHPDCCKNICVPYSIFLLSSIPQGLWQGDPGKNPRVMDGSVWHWRPRRCCKNNRVPYLFFRPASRSELPKDGGEAPVCKARVWHPARKLLQEHLRTLFNFLFSLDCSAE